MNNPVPQMPNAPLPDSPLLHPPLPGLTGPVLRTPESCFEGLTDFAYPAHYREVGGLRIACIDEGPRDGPVVLLMHGEPTWAYLYRKMIPILVDAGFRVVAPDLVGLGRSDKPTRRQDYRYAHHVAWMNAWLLAMDLRGITLFCQDWGSLIGLRMACALPARFDRIAIGNGGLPTGTERIPRAFHLWRAFARYSPVFPIGKIVAAGCAQGLSPEARRAYDAPFPSARYKAGARAFPTLVPTTPGDPERAPNEAAWQVLEHWQKPFLTLFSNRDPITRGVWRLFQSRVPGCQGQPHRNVRGGGHFLQEDCGPEVAQALVEFVRGKPQD
jgi:haloalkane dehalogenase